MEAARRSNRSQGAPFAPRGLSDFHPSGRGRLYVKPNPLSSPGKQQGGGGGAACSAAASANIPYVHDGSGRDIHTNTTGAFRPIGGRMPVSALQLRVERGVDRAHPAADRALAPTRSRTDPVSRYWPDGNGRDTAYVDHHGRVGDALRAGGGDVAFRGSAPPVVDVVYMQLPPGRGGGNNAGQQRPAHCDERARAHQAAHRRQQSRAMAGLTRSNYAPVKRFEHVVLQPAPGYRTARQRCQAARESMKLSYCL